MSLFFLCLALAGEPSLGGGPDPRTVVGEPAGPVLSGDVLEAKTKEIAALIRCPVCQGSSVEASPSESARAMRDEVKALVALGYDRDQVTAYFVASYGDFILLEPKKEGFAVWVWLLPPLFLTVAGIGVALHLRGRGLPPPPPPRPPPPDPELGDYLERVRKETAGQ
ncbi:MAG TPA: cytochrome c-type biogenesis protein CcmH [Myxococcota bacterium]|nr:cytochrome c-type biogenesis protein CcmH [Myxococcota bacterium]